MPNLEQQIAGMVNTRGVYLLSDRNVIGHPLGHPFAIVVSVGGKLIQMRPDGEISTEGFLESCLIAGPFLPPKS